MSREMDKARFLWSETSRLRMSRIGHWKGKNFGLFIFLHFNVKQSVFKFCSLSLLIFKRGLRFQLRAVLGCWIELFDIFWCQLLLV